MIEKNGWKTIIGANIIDVLKSKVDYEDFINKEMIHFSKYDCERSIPNMIDGLKTSLRKILFSAFKRNLVNEIKVAQFAGYVFRTFRISSW